MMLPTAGSGGDGALEVSIQILRPASCPAIATRRYSAPRSATASCATLSSPGRTRSACEPLQVVTGCRAGRGSAAQRCAVVLVGHGGRLDPEDPRDRRSKSIAARSRRKPIGTVSGARDSRELRHSRSIGVCQDSTVTLVR